MITKSNVINLDEHRKNAKQNILNSKLSKSAEVTDITSIRQEMISEERRKVKRTILTEFLGATIVVPGQGLMKVTIYDISDDGFAFDLEVSEGKFKVGEEVAVRVYMNNQTYFPFSVKITHIKTVVDEAVYRHGSKFVKDTVNKEALHHFVKFIESVSASLKGDNGDIMVSNLK